jgi:hypothetical protein
MQRCEIPPEHWTQCLDRFNRMHVGRPAHVCTSGAPAGCASNADDLPLIGVTAGDRAPGNVGELHVMVGGPGAPHDDHLVPRPRRLWMADWNDGCSSLLEIDSDDGSTTLVQVGPPEQLLPEGMIVDGVPPERPA